MDIQITQLQGGQLGHSACTLCNSFGGIARAAVMLHMLVCTVLTIFQGRGRAFACVSAHVLHSRAGNYAH